MDSQRWNAIRATFDELVELDAGNRSDRLSVLGQTDPALRIAVESLLDADAEANAFLAPLDEILVSQGDPAPDPINLVGCTISNFKVEEPLGAGGMGVVYRGRDTRLGRPVALKFLLPHYSLDNSAKRRFLREARAAAALDHPHLCTIYDVREGENGRLFLAMALYEGETLKQRLSRDGPLPLAEAIAIAKQIAHGVGCAHGAGIVHRDLKPGNVMLLPDGTVKILDFGLAKALDETTAETGQGFGTVAYMAPEQIRGEQVDPRADLWAMGVVLYEMLTGRKPFTGEHEVAIAHAVVHDDPIPPSTHREGLPAAIEDIVLALLSKDPSMRCASVDELIADLATVGALDEFTGRSVLRRRLFRRRPLATRTWMMTLAAGLVVGGFGGVAIARALHPNPPRPVLRYPIGLPDTAGLAVVSDGFRVAISPGGEHLAYVGDGPNGSSRLWVWSREQLAVRPLPGTEGATNPFFSPDGSWVGFVTTDLPRALKVVSLDGGSPTTVTDSLVDGGGATWGYDGYIYFDASEYGIGRVLATGGAPEPVTKHDAASGEMWHYQPESLPNGRGVLFVIRRRGPMSESDIAVLDFESGAYHVLRRGLTARYSPSGHLVYGTVDGSMMAVPFDQDRMTITGEPVILAEGLQMQSLGEADLAISTAGTFAYVVGRVPAGQNELVWVTRAGEATPVDTTWRADFGPLELSPDGSALAVSVVESGDFHIWLKQLNRGPASKLTLEGAFTGFPSWTLDGQALTFVGDSGIRLARADGSVRPRLLRHESGALREVEFSSDGKWLIYRNTSDLFAARTEGDTTRITLVATKFDEFTPRLSPNGRWLAYTSDESGRHEVYVRPFPNTRTERRQVSTAGGMDPVWSRDGRELFYKNGHNELVAVAVMSGTTFTPGEQRVLFSTAKYEGVWKSYDVSSDGRRFIMIRLPGKSRDELILVENFFRELKEKVKRTDDR